MSLRFIKVNSPEPVVRYVADAIRQHLRAGEPVLWQMSGGSAIAVEAAITRELAGESLTKLTATLTDERPGAVGHSDSNWAGLEAAGFTLPEARLVPVLTGADTAADTTSFNHFLDTELNRKQFRIALFGIGPDGHTAGLPARNAAPSEATVAYYEAGPFQRISMTPAAISRLDVAVVYAVGEAKWPQLDRFAAELPVTEQSAQALKLAPKVIVFNDHQGESS